MEKQAFQDSILRNFTGADGRLKSIPSQKKKKLVILEHMVAKLDPSKTYNEKEVNEFIKQFHDDFCTIRREFVINGYVNRENSIYSVNDKEEWNKWQDL
ncbi:DUF2087 domain-containing protein [Fictibacillus aquaticus]|uniref:Transcriptional regulator n=1 Tax=Fictibacillus aquaticus TaxID=2021314 RepID=A0A235FDB6_9BACL|nr:DUF2087 domain-containing protein [Fictibacillus aquaticus]OYD59301.1 transcriptional regulator [Fictibacillus aquaticus]